MPTIDLSLTITAIIGLAAIFSPILTSLINNHHQLKMKKLELQHEDALRREAYEREIYEGYIRAAGACTQVHGADLLRKFGEASSVAQFYVPDDVREKMQKLEKVLRGEEKANNRELLVQIITDLRNIKEPTCMQCKQKSHKRRMRRTDREKSSS